MEGSSLHYTEIPVILSIKDSTVPNFQSGYITYLSIVQKTDIDRVQAPFYQKGLGGSCLLEGSGSLVIHLSPACKKMNSMELSCKKNDTGAEGSNINFGS